MRKGPSLLSLFYVSALVINLFNATIFIFIKRNREKSLIEYKNIGQTYNSYKTDFVSKKGLSACLLVRDENENLVEWLAYHYVTLPLRNLVVAIDPESNNNKKSILSQLFTKWREMNVKIVTWDNDWFMPNKETRGKLPPHSPKSVKIRRHRLRQVSFALQCLHHHKKNDRTWVLLIDPDEFIIPNKLTSLEEFNEALSFAKSNKSTHVNEAYPLYNISSSIAFDRKILEQRKALPISPWQRTIEEIIDSESYSYPWNSSSCIHIPRLKFGTYIEGSNSLALPELSRNFKTLQYFRHAEKNNFFHNQYSKAIIDVSQIPFHSLLKQRFYNPKRNIHRPIQECSYPLVPYYYSLFRINHYSTPISFETNSPFFDSKPHRSIEDTVQGMLVNEGANYDMRGWLDQFVNQVGKEKAQELLTL